MNSKSTAIPNWPANRHTSAKRSASSGRSGSSPEHSRRLAPSSAPASNKWRSDATFVVRPRPTCLDRAHRNPRIGKAPPAGANKSIAGAHGICRTARHRRGRAQIDRGKTSLGRKRNELGRRQIEKTERREAKPGHHCCILSAADSIARTRQHLRQPSMRAEGTLQ